MSFRIGFLAGNTGGNAETPVCTESGQMETVIPRKSVVQVYFAARNRTLAYYNDQFDLHCGDTVYVEGKLEGLRGRVTAVDYNFKIRLSDYKRVIAVADTTVSGRLLMAGSHFLTFDRNVLPAGKVTGWFKAPPKEESEIVCGSDETSFPLKNLSAMKVGEAIAERGCDYYREDRVRYISLDGTMGYAIVEGSEPYEVEFTYCDGEISGLVCSCYCSGSCKHGVAAMLQLRELLELIGKQYDGTYQNTGYFAAVSKSTLFEFAVSGKDTGSITF